MHRVFSFLSETKWLLLLILMLAGGFMYVSIAISPAPAQTHFTDLAASFLHGRLDLIQPVRLFDDFTVFEQKDYVYFGPFPGVLLMPIVLLFGNNFSQQLLLVIPSFLLTAFFLYNIARSSGIEKRKDALWLVIAFLFASPYIFLAITQISAYVVQVVGLACLSGALYFYLCKKNPLLVGLFLVFAGLTRSVLFLGGVFFFLEYARTKKYMDLSLFTLSVAAGIEIFFGYNFLRFHNILETGYGYFSSGNPIYQALKQQGTFSVQHIPTNLYYMLLKTPDLIIDGSYRTKFPFLRVNEWGMGVFFTSPIFLVIFFIKRKSPIIVSSIITILLMLIPILTYYATGLWQYGSRYAVDFFPFLFLLVASFFVHHKFSWKFQALTLATIVFEFCFMYSIFYKYPFPTQ